MGVIWKKGFLILASYPDQHVYCQDDVEDEFHFILNSPQYYALRTTFNKPHWYRYPSVFKFLLWYLCKANLSHE